MINPMLIDNNDLLALINSLGTGLKEDDFISLLEYLYRGRYQIALYEHDSIDAIYEKIYEYKFSEDVKIISQLIDRLVCYLSEDEFKTQEFSLSYLGNKEGRTIKEIITRKAIFDYEVKYIKYSLYEKSTVRMINKVEDVKEILFIFLKEKRTAAEVIDGIKIITGNLVFDEEILYSIEKLNDGFESRKLEIIYHLYCIDNEVPVIIQSGVSGYAEIGNQLSIDCSPERNRETVGRELSKELEGHRLNCELHTKMDTLSARAPDRIYFCPNVPDNFSELYKGKVYIYKISNHV